MNIIVLGSGAWGTALAMLLVQNGHRVTLWCRNPEKAQEMRLTLQNPRLEGVSLPPALSVSHRLEDAREAELVLFATPSFSIRETAQAAAPFLRPDSILLSAAKGVEQDTCLRMTEILQQVCGSSHPAAALSGPSHAEEVARQMPTGVVAASEDLQTAKAVQDVFMNPYFRVYTNTDIIGVELCGALKNIVALGCGIADGLGYGDNARALLITRAMSEAGTLCFRAGGKGSTIGGLAGTGDLIVTCTSRHSRNHRAGILIGQGHSVEEAIRQVGAVVEGYYAAHSFRRLAEKLQVPMPICESIHAVLYHGMRPDGAMRLLMERDRKEEFPSHG